MKRFRWLLACLVLWAIGLPALAAPQTLLPATTITGTGPTASFSLQPGQNAELFMAGGTATLQVERSPDNGSTWYKYDAAGSNQIYVWTLTGDNQSDTLQGAATGVLYRFNCTSYTSNVVVTVLGQGMGR